MPGTVALAPGGLMWWHIIELFEALAAKGQSSLILFSIS
jgi:arginase family enzyme